MTDSVVCNGNGISHTSTSLLARAKAYDQTAWQRLVRLYSPLVYHWSRSKGLQAADALDIGQEVFASVARKLVHFRHDRPDDTFRGWLNRITQNKILDHRRRLVHRPLGTGACNGSHRNGVSSAVSPDDDSSDCDERAWICRRAVTFLREEFEERTWRAFWQTAVSQRRAKEVAAELGMTTNAVYLARHRVLERLRAEFEDLLDDAPW